MLHMAESPIILNKKGKIQMDYKTWPRDVSLTKTCVCISLISRIILVIYWWITLTVVNNPWDYPPITGFNAVLWEITTVLLTTVLIFGIGTLEHRAVTYYWKKKKYVLKFLWLLFNILIPVCGLRYLFTDKGKQKVPEFWAAYGPEYEEKFLDSDCKLVAKAVSPRYFTKLNNSKEPQGFTALSPMGTIKVEFDAPKMVAHLELELPSDLEIYTAHFEYFKAWRLKEDNSRLICTEVDLQPLFTAKEVAAYIVCMIDKLCLAWPFLTNLNPFGGSLYESRK